MVVGVRKNMMLLFENKLSYIFCVVGAGVTNPESAWSVMAYQTQPALLAGMFIVRDILPCVLWNLNQLWLRLTPVLSDWR